MNLSINLQVTLAAKMENSGQPDRIQMSLKSQQLLAERYPEFRMTPRGGVRIDVSILAGFWDSIMVLYILQFGNV